MMKLKFKSYTKHQSIKYINTADVRIPSDIACVHRIAPSDRERDTRKLKERESES